ncbi:MAG: NFACT family protein, partial [Oscillospiraceae bacterium]|nr:NFACT family protein [Oscillospiraceae bacterium]
DELKKSGDLIMANLYRLSRGDTLLRAEDFYSDAGGEVEIKLDPLLSPQDNAAVYYKKYKKAKTAVVYLNENIEKAKTELDYLESVLEEIERASSPAELSEIRAELSAGGYIAPQRGKSKAKTKAPESSPLHFTSPSGFDIYVGKNNSQNDILTFKTAMRGDIWLHAQKIHGAHVIIASGGREVDEKTLLQAASLAAYYSRGRESGRVPVDYTAVKFVRKPPGGKPGAAVYTEYSTVYAVPSEKI